MSLRCLLKRAEPTNQLKHQCGTLRQLKDERDWRYDPADDDDKQSARQRRLGDVCNVLLPPIVDLSQRPHSPKIQHQGALNSCSASSVAYAVSYLLGTGDSPGQSYVSRLFIYYHARRLGGLSLLEDTGTYLRDAYKAVAKCLVCFEQDWPYFPENMGREPDNHARSRLLQSFRHLQYLAVEPHLDHLRICIANGFPISFATLVYESMLFVTSTGDIPIPDPWQEEAEPNGHAMTIVGYDDTTRRFKVANSWGTQWGDRGYGYLAYDLATDTDFSYDFWTPRLSPVTSIL